MVLVESSNLVVEAVFNFIPFRLLAVEQLDLISSK